MCLKTYYVKIYLVIKMDLPKRKPTRLKDYNYSSFGSYFITIFTHNRKCILSDIVGDGVYDIPKINLTECGMILEKYIIFMNTKYNNISIDKYTIMPNHIHLIIKIENKFPDGTSHLSCSNLFFNFLKTKKTSLSTCLLARCKRFELLAFWSVAKRSIQLS